MDLSAQIALRKWCELLEIHGGRDKVIRITGYVCTLYSDLPGIRGTSSSKKVLIVGKQLSYCRTILRLFDDLPMLNRTLSYGLGSNEKDLISRLTNLLSNVINTIYYPLEHIAWAGDQGVIAVDSKPFWRGVSYCWASTLYLSIVRTVRTISMLIQQRRRIVDSGCRPSDIEISKYQTGMLSQLFALIQQLSDFGLAINSIPGFLWGGKLQPRHSALLGIISTFINLCKMLKFLP